MSQAPRITVEQLKEAQAQLAKLKAQGEELERKLRNARFPSEVLTVAEQIRFSEIRKTIPVLESQLKLLIEVLPIAEKMKQASEIAGNPKGEAP